MQENYRETQLDDTEQLNYIYNLGRTVRFMASIDMLFAFLYTFTNPYYLIYSFVNFLFSCCGYYGSKTYSSSLICCYLFYNILKIIGNILILVSNINNNNLQERLFTFTFIASIIIIINIYLTSIVLKFYNQIKNLPQHLMEELKTGPRVIVFTYW